MEDQDLIVRVQNGDLEAYGQLMDLHVRRLRAYVAFNAPALFLVDEVAHEVFVFAYRHIAEFKAGTSFQAYLRAIADQTLRAEVQRFSREKSNQMKYAERLAVERLQRRPAATGSSKLDHLEDCLQNLPPKLRELLDSRYKLALSTQEIAQLFKQSGAWIRTTLCRLRIELKECIEAKWSREGA